METKKLFIKTYGCQSNVYDSTRMADMLKHVGYQLITPELQACDSENEGTNERSYLADADMVILNTCHIREKASEKMYAELGRIRMVKEARASLGKETLIAIAGCVGQAEGEEIFRRAPFVNIVVGPQSYQNLPKMIGEIQRKGKLINLDFPKVSKFDVLPQSSEATVSAFLSIQEGCDKFCTFCVVPYTRGAEYSRDIASIYRETVAFVAAGAKEVQLLGQNVNAFHGEGPDGKAWDLGMLIKHVAAIPGLERIRYTTSHPRDMHESLFEAHAQIESLMPFVHLPVQSGSNTILAAMNRQHTAEYYLKQIDKLRAARQDMQFSSDFIVGFPGETEKDFEETLALVKEVHFAQAYSFKYSSRPGTPGADMPNQVPEEIKSERLSRLQQLLREQQYAFNEKMVGVTVPVLFMKPGRKPGQMIGKTPFLQSVHVGQAEGFANQIVDVQIVSAGMNSLEGVIPAILEKVA